MDPISIAVELELATLILAGVGTFATWLHHKREQHAAVQRERHHQEMKSLHERQHAERIRAIHNAPPEVAIDIQTANIE